MVRRWMMFIALNFVIIMTLSVILSVLGVGPYLTQKGISYSALLAFSLVWGFGGAFISLCLSKWFARRAMGVRIITSNTNQTANEARLTRLMDEVCHKAGFTYPLELGTFDSAKPNAFATGRSQKSSMIAASNSLIESMNDEELSAVLAHELSHVRSGDMVSMTLLQGSINAFVIFISRALAYAMTRGSSKDSRRSVGMSYYFTVMITEMVLMIPAMMLMGLFSRRREFRADRGAAKVTGANSMIRALRRLEAGALSQKESAKLKPYAAFMINKTQKPLLRLFATHPPIEARIKYLESLQDEALVSSAPA